MAERDGSRCSSVLAASCFARSFPSSPPLPPRIPDAFAEGYFSATAPRGNEPGKRERHARPPARKQSFMVARATATEARAIVTRRREGERGEKERREIRLRLYLIQLTHHEITAGYFVEKMKFFPPSLLIGIFSFFFTEDMSDDAQAEVTGWGIDNRRASKLRAEY